MAFRKWLAVALLIGMQPLALATTGSILAGPAAASLREREREIWLEASHVSEFATAPHVGARRFCEDTEIPEALATPNPLLDLEDSGDRVTITFIIGTDGRVHSPLILESAGAMRDHAVLRAVRSWLYRPAMCNGVPTEAEGKIRFSSR